MGSNWKISTPLTPLKGGVTRILLCRKYSPLQAVRRVGGYRGVLFTFLLFLSHFLPAQDAVPTLNQFSPLQYQPAAPALDHTAGLSLFREEMQIGPGTFVTTDAFNAELPFVQKATGYRPLGIGLGFVQNDFGQADMLKINEINLSLASSVQLTPRQFLALGVAGTFVNKRTSLEHLSTGSQWIESEFRYDPGAALGETFARNQVNYLSLGSGIYWSLTERDQQKAFISLSAFHLNQPTESFFQEKVKVPMFWLVNAGAVVLQTDRWTVKPVLFYQMAGVTERYQLITSASLQFENSNPYDLISTGSLELLLNLSSEKELGVGLVIHQPHYRIGGGYQLPLGDNEIYQNRFQVAVSFDFLTRKSQPQKIVVEEPKVRHFDFRDPKDKLVKAESEIAVIEEKLKELGEVKSLQFELTKDFQFQYGKAGLIGRNDPFLKDLTRLLMENPDYRLQIIGHTDNMGSHQVNLELSRARAQALASHLIANGASEKQIRTVGMGDTQPIAEGYTEEAKARNRRVEFIISIEK